jgi:hypothetical protein
MQKQPCHDGNHAQGRERSEQPEYRNLEAARRDSLTPARESSPSEPDATYASTKTAALRDKVYGIGCE